jgi:hypothetical protein
LNRLRILGSLLTGLLTLTLASRAAADEVSPRGKGITGGGLLGAEIAVVTEAVIGLQNPWWYAAGVAVGGGGGAVGGYFIEEMGGAAVPTAMLVAGMAFLIPTTIVYFNATDEQAFPEDDAAPSDPPPSGEFELSAALIDVRPSGFRLGVPSLELREVYSPSERAQFGVKQRTEFAFSLLGATF